jgi:type II secretion system protein C
LLLIKLALVLALGHVIIKTATMPQRARLKLAPSSAGASEKGKTVDKPPASAAEAPDHSGVLTRNLFGGQDRATGKAISPPVADSLAAASKGEDDELGLALIGTIAGSPALSRAIIKDLETNVLGHYKTGDKVQSAIIRSIEKDRVVLFHEGRRKVLGQEFMTIEETGSRATEPIQTNASKPVVIKPPQRGLNTLADRLRHTALMLPKAKVEPHSVAGEVDGLRISDLDDIEGAEDLGLKEGDVIRAINGHRLNSKQKAFQIAMKARSQAALDIELMRDDEIKKFSLPLK